jgi:hypothetical protein
MVRRRGIIRSAARTAGRTALIAGTATAVTGRVAARQQKKLGPQQPQGQTHEPDHMSVHGEGNIVGHLQQLADLRASGALTDKEFAAAKARLFKS